MTPKQKKFLDKKEQDILNKVSKETAQEMAFFKKVLLKLGGKHIVWRYQHSFKYFLQEESFRNWLKALTDPEIATTITQPRIAFTVDGAPNDCHGNAARLWKRDPDNIVIMTGYALSDDDLWREHTWALKPKGDIILDSLPKRKIYLGISLPPKEAELFHKDNT
jgi:hypothetical protein